MGDSLLRTLHENELFALNFTHETKLTIMKLGTDTEPPFSRLKVWRQNAEQEPSLYEVQVNRYDVITRGGVSVYLWDGSYDAELWKLDPETPVPKELVFTLTPGTGEVSIRPFFTTTTHEQFRKMLGCLRWVKVGNRPESTASI